MTRGYCRRMTTIDQTQQDAALAMVSPGDWLTGAQRRAVWDEVRDARTNDLDERRRTALSPNAVDGRHPATGHLSAAAMEVVHRVASDPGRLTRSWADEQMSELGEETYTELVGVTAIAATLDTFDRAMGRSLREPGDVIAGDPARERPDDVGDVGAWVSQTVGPTRANVSRTLSLVPVTNAAWRGMVDAHYSHGADFANLTWDRPLSRPQAELLASRATVLNECFY